MVLKDINVRDGHSHPVQELGRCIRWPGRREEEEREEDEKEKQATDEGGGGGGG